MPTLQFYTNLSKGIIRTYLCKNYKWFENKDRTTKKLITLVSDELIGKCIARLVKSDADFVNGKSRLDINQYRRMNVIYTIRNYFHEEQKRNSRFKPESNMIYYEDCVGTDFVDEISQNEEKQLMIIRVEKSPLGYRQKKYILELLKGKSILDIAKENHTKSRCVERFVKEGILQLDKVEMGFK